MCLAVVVIRVLANDDDLDVVEGCVTRPRGVLEADIKWTFNEWHGRHSKALPRVDILPGREDLLSSGSLSVQKSFQVQELF